MKKLKIQALKYQYVFSFAILAARKSWYYLGFKD